MVRLSFGLQAKEMNHEAAASIVKVSSQIFKIFNLSMDVSWFSCLLLQLLCLFLAAQKSPPYTKTSEDFLCNGRNRLGSACVKGVRVWQNNVEGLSCL